jgi:2-polyprenyl-6-methoxyphenol hydroxylase-like FAD-dependent oxidoreductase
VVLLGDAAHAPLPHQGQGAGLAIEDAYALGALLGRGGLDDYGLAFEAFEHLRKRRTALVQAYSRASGRAVKLAGDAAARRDASWPSLPQRIGWIHRYREEEMLSSPARFGASAPAGRAVLRCGNGRAVRQARRPGRRVVLLHLRAEGGGDDGAGRRR